MTGLDTILSKITEDAEAVAALRIEAAKNRAAQIGDENLKKARETGDLRLNDARAQADRIRSRAQAAAKTSVRNAILAERNRVIDEVIDAAFRSLSETDAADAFAYISSYIESCPIDGHATVILSARDLARVPADFAAKLSERIGQTIIVRDEPGNFSFGCVAIAGEIEYNGTAEAILYDRRDALRDAVYGILFANQTEGAS